MLQYYPLLFDSYFWRHTFAVSLCYMILILNWIVTPLVFQQQLHITPLYYALVMTIPLLGMFLGSLTSFHYAHHQQTAIIGALFTLLGGILLVISKTSLALVITGLFMQALGSGGILTPILMSRLLAPYRQNSGTVTALCNMLKMLISAIIASLLNDFLYNNINHLGISFIIIAILIYLLTSGFSSEKITIHKKIKDYSNS